MGPVSIVDEGVCEGGAAEAVAGLVDDEGVVEETGEGAARLFGV